MFTDNLLQGFTGALIIALLTFYLTRKFVKKDEKFKLETDHEKRIVRIETEIESLPEIRTSLVNQFKNEIKRLDDDIDDIKTNHKLEMNELRISVEKDIIAIKRLFDMIKTDLEKLGGEIILKLNQINDNMAKELNQCPNHKRQS